MSAISWARRASFYLLKDLNCATASFEVFQDMTGLRDDELLQAVTGLEGGVVASGETCGVLTGGAMGIALLHEREIIENGPVAELKILYAVRDYVRWFEDSFKTTRCCERSGVDFYTAPGQVRFFLPGDRVGRCLWHISRAAKEFEQHMEKGLPLVVAERQVNVPVHCALPVLKAVRERTGVGSEKLERLSFVFDGGLGLTGGVCGALAGAVMAVNSEFGMRVRQQSYPKTIKVFIDGHLNLLGEKPSKMPEAFGIGRGIVETFRKKTGGFLTCRNITKSSFNNWHDFQEHMCGSKTCRELTTYAADLANEAIEDWIPTKSGRLAQSR